jgi:hypothetical protein
MSSNTELALRVNTSNSSIVRRGTYAASDASRQSAERLMSINVSKVSEQTASAIDQADPPAPRRRRGYLKAMTASL